jgi:outer membrane lipoprotein SlyB
MKKLIISVILIMFGTQAMAVTEKRVATVTDHYSEMVYLEPYTVEVCSNEQIIVGSQADVVNGAIWGAIFGAVVGDAIDDEDGRVPGAVIGALIGSDSAQGQGTTVTTAMVCKQETRNKRTVRKVYSHSTIGFSWNMEFYEIKFIKK